MKQVRSAASILGTAEMDSPATDSAATSRREANQRAAHAVIVVHHRLVVAQSLLAILGWHFGVITVPRRFGIEKSIR